MSEIKCMVCLFDESAEATHGLPAEVIVAGNSLCFVHGKGAYDRIRQALTMEAKSSDRCNICGWTHPFGTACLDGKSRPTVGFLPR